MPQEPWRALPPEAPSARLVQQHVKDGHPQTQSGSSSMGNRVIMSALSRVSVQTLLAPPALPDRKEKCLTPVKRRLSRSSRSPNWWNTNRKSLPPCGPPARAAVMAHYNSLSLFHGLSTEEVHAFFPFPSSPKFLLRQPLLSLSVITHVKMSRKPLLFFSDSFYISGNHVRRPFRFPLCGTAFVPCLWPPASGRTKTLLRLYPDQRTSSYGLIRISCFQSSAVLVPCRLRPSSPIWKISYLRGGS